MEDASRNRTGLTLWHLPDIRRKPKNLMHGDIVLSGGIVSDHQYEAVST